MALKTVIPTLANDYSFTYVNFVTNKAFSVFPAAWTKEYKLIQEIARRDIGERERWNREWSYVFLKSSLAFDLLYT